MSDNVHPLIGRSVRVRCKSNPNRHSWARVDVVQETALGFRIWVSAGHRFGSARWVLPEEIDAKTLKDQALINSMKCKAAQR